MGAVSFYDLFDKIQFVENGKEQLKKFDNYEQRADKLIRILEEMVVSNN